MSTPDSPVGFINGVATAWNGDFTGDDAASINNGLVTDNQVWMGQTAVNANNSHVFVKTVTAGTNIDFDVTDTTFTINSTAAATDLHVARYIVSPGGTADGANYTTITSAVAAAGAQVAIDGNPQTVYIQPSNSSAIYAESFTLPANVSIVGSGGDAANVNVLIFGKITQATDGIGTIANVALQGNNDNCLVVPSGGEANAGTYLINCQIIASTATAISMAGSQGLYFYGCEFEFSDPTQLLLAQTAGNSYFYNCLPGNGGGTGASTISGSANCFISNSRLNFPISSSSTGIFNAVGLEMTVANATALTFTGVGTITIDDANLTTGTASALSIGAGVTATVSRGTVSSSNTNAITGAGIINYNGLCYTGTSVTMNTTTQSPNYMDLGKYRARGQPAFMAYQASVATNATGDGTVYVLGTTVDLTEIYDQNSNFDHTTGTFTAPVTGKYMFTVNIFVNGGTDITEYEVRINTTARQYRNRSNFGASADRTAYAVSYSMLADMTAADTATFSVYTIDAGGKIDDVFGAADEYWTTVAGYLAC